MADKWTTSLLEMRPQPDYRCEIRARPPISSPPLGAAGAVLVSIPSGRPCPDRPQADSEKVYHPSFPSAGVFVILFCRPPLSCAPEKQGGLNCPLPYGALPLLHVRNDKVLLTLLPHERHPLARTWEVLHHTRPLHVPDERVAQRRYPHRGPA